MCISTWDIQLLVMCDKLSTGEYFGKSQQNDRKRGHMIMTVQSRHDERDGVSNHRRLSRLLSRLFRRRSKKNQSSVLLAFVRGTQQ